MTKTFKKLTALAMAAVTAGAIGMSAAAAPIEYKTWSVAHVNTQGAPSILNYTTVYMNASLDTYEAAVTDMTDLVSREITITCDSHTMMPCSLVYNQINMAQTWTINPETGPARVTYNVSAHTTVSAVLSAKGYISRYYEP